MEFMDKIMLVVFKRAQYISSHPIGPQNVSIFHLGGETNRLYKPHVFQEYEKSDNFVLTTALRRGSVRELHIAIRVPLIVARVFSSARLRSRSWTKNLHSSQRASA